MQYLMGTHAPDSPPVTAWERWLVGIAALLALVLGLSYLHVPALWHDELVHVFVAKNIVAEGRPELPSGHFYTSGTTFNFLLAGFIALFGDGEFAVRLPSVLIGTGNVVLLYVLTRQLLGRPTALLAAFALALSPWHVAWTREARFYELHLTMYLLFIGACWLAMNSTTWRRVAGWGMGALAVYGLAILTSFQSVIFAAAPGAFLAIMIVINRGERKRWAAMALVLAGPAAVALLGLYLYLPAADWKAIFEMGGFGGQLVEVTRDWVRSARWFYTRWLQQNLGTGFLLLAYTGTALLALREGKRGLFMVLAFWAPLLVLTFLVGYRRARFIYFIYPFYIVAWCYALVMVCRFLTTSRESSWRGVAAVLAVMFLARLGLSFMFLTGDSIHTASGAHVTLERRHPLWKEPSRFVKDRLDGRAVISTTYLPVLYYVGQCDEWYPSRIIVWEYIESGSKGLRDVADLKAYMEANPRGFFLADRLRFSVWRHFAEDRAFVREHMRFVPEASNHDILVYAWPKDEPLERTAAEIGVRAAAALQ